MKQQFLLLFLQNSTLLGLVSLRISSDQIVKNSGLSSLGFMISDWEAMAYVAQIIIVVASPHISIYVLDRLI
jgi:hypothetical protein